MSNDPGREGPNETLPTISVVVNTCDRRDELRNLLYSLEQQDYPPFEVVVVLGPTSDDSREMLAGELGDRISLVRCPEFNLSTSRNLGIANAAGDVVAFIDDDAVPSRRWLRQIARPYADPLVAGVGGSTNIVNPGQGQIQFFDGLATVLAEQFDVLLDPVDRPPFVAPDHLVFPRFHGTNMSYRRQALLDINGFDESFDYLFDDADIGVRLGLANRRLVQLSDAVVYHRPTAGRNRGDHPYDLNWYCWLRSIVYFALKNGGPTVGWNRSLTHAFRMTSTMFAQVKEAAESDLIPPELHRKAKKMLRRGAIAGVLQGLLWKRRIPSRIDPVKRELKPFLPRVQDRDASPSGGAADIKGFVASARDTALRICLLSIGYPPTHTHGVSRSTATLARGLVELGHDVHVVTSGRRLHVTCRDGVYLHEVAGAEYPRYSRIAHRGYVNLAHWLNHSHAVFEAVESIRRTDGIQLVDSPLWGLEGLVTSVKGEIPMAVRVVTSMKQIADVHKRPSLENGLIGELEERFLSMADLVVSNSNATSRTIETVYGLSHSDLNLGLAPYGMIPASETLVQPLSETEVDAPVVLFVGRLEKRKGVLELFDAIPQVLDRFPGTRFLLAGSDNSAEDGFFDDHGSDYPTYFRKKYPPNSAMVEFLGFVDEDRLDELYRSCTLFVAPSLYESFGLIFLEAMNWARPVIGCSAGGPEDIVVDGETGRLVPPGDAPALADAICGLLSSSRRRREMGLAGRRRLVEKYSHLAMARSFEILYRGLLESNKKAGQNRAGE